MPKGYWINHVEEIIDQDAFGRYITKWNALVDRGEAKVIVIGPVAKTQIGPVDMQRCTQGAWPRRNKGGQEN